VFDLHDDAIELVDAFGSNRGFLLTKR